MKRVIHTHGLSKQKLRPLVRGVLAVVMIVAVSACTAQKGRVNLSPADWPEGELEKYAELGQFRPGSNYLATGSAGMVTATMGAPAVRAGLEALKQGGSAADAAMVTALAQVALTPGDFITYAGILTMVYYDAATGKVYSMNAAYNTPRDEKDPLSIPAQGSGTPSGRATLVPGFMAGVGAAHDRFGKLPFEALFQPAIYFAKEGFRLDPFRAGLIESQKRVLSRLPETRRIFTKENGEFYTEGDWFRQPDLAETLRAIATQGVEYMYTGPWAERFVQAVQRDGGKITLEDMAAYEVIWSEPVHTTYRGYEVYGPGLPALGGVNTIEAFNLLEAADLRQYGHYSESPESLFWFMQITRAWALSFFSPQELATMVPGRDLSPESRLTKETAGWLWEQMQRGELPFAVMPTGKPGEHSAAVVTVDRWGNVAAVVHTINALWWGETGIFVDGVSVPDSATHQQHLVARAGPGSRLPDPTNPLIILRDGKPVVGSACIGQIHLETMQRLVNILDHGMDPKSALDAPAFLAPYKVGAPDVVGRVAEGESDVALLDAVRAMGQPVEELRLPLEELALVRGWWVGIVLNPQTGTLEGAAPRLLGGYAEGY
jgi:gamma-glutamyltranspeptidase/glutathione hydrolase